MAANKFKFFLGLQQKEVCERHIGFDSYDMAVKFTKELLSDSYEIQRVVINTEFNQLDGKQPHMNFVGGETIYVDFLYNAYEKHDRALLRRLLDKYSDHII